MAEITRQNEITCIATFAAADGSATVPTNAEATVKYLDLSGRSASVTFPLALQADGTWQAKWDSSVASAGLVEWVARCWGGIKGADQGSFYIKANGANV
jgi:hypothetical protein